MSDLVVKLGRCRYLSLVRNKWFCALDPLSSNLWEVGPRGVRTFNLKVFESIPELDTKKCIDCFSYIEAEKFLPREIREKKVRRNRAFRLENY